MAKAIAKRSEFTARVALPAIWIKRVNSRCHLVFSRSIGGAMNAKRVCMDFHRAVLRYNPFSRRANAVAMVLAYYRLILRRAFIIIGLRNIEHEVLSPKDDLGRQ